MHLSVFPLKTLISFVLCLCYDRWALSNFWLLEQGRLDLGCSHWLLPWACFLGAEQCSSSATAFFILEDGILNVFQNFPPFDSHFLWVCNSVLLTQLVNPILGDDLKHFWKMPISVVGINIFSPTVFFGSVSKHFHNGHSKWVLL